jgi:hypothetical protein
MGRAAILPTDRTKNEEMTIDGVGAVLHFGPAHTSGVWLFTRSKIAFAGSLPYRIGFP